MARRSEVLGFWVVRRVHRFSFPRGDEGKREIGALGTRAGTEKQCSSWGMSGRDRYEIRKSRLWSRIFFIFLAE
jgi:hypothetical protein